MHGNDVLKSEIRFIIQLSAVDGLDVMITVVAEVYPVRFLSLGVKIVELCMVGILAERAFQTFTRPFKSAE